MFAKKTCWLLLLSTGISAHPFTECENGMADFYACNNTDLLHRIHLEDLGDGTGSGNDIWGWTDPLDGKEYALMGLSNGTAFVDISTPKTPVYLGYLPTASSNSLWRDIKTYANHAFIVSEASGHGMQVFDLTQLRNVPAPPVTFTATANYNEFGNAHNIVINEDSGYAYAVGANCSGGLHMVDISIPTTPVNMGCFSADGYTHDAQCVIYTGPDVEHNGQELCFNSNEDTLTIVDVTDKTSPVQISRTPYNDSRYTHQGWLTEDQRYYLMNDELDEQNLGHNTKTYIWDLQDLDNPVIIGTYLGPQPSVDHNLYIKGNFAYLSNYTSGLSVVDITDVAAGQLAEVAGFDTYPDSNTNQFDGAWSNYPFFDSGNVILSDISGGLFILDPLLCPQTSAPNNLQAEAAGDNAIALTWNDSLAAGEHYRVFRSEGGCAVNNFIELTDQLTAESFTDSTASGLVNVGYQVAKVNAEGVCESTRSTCVEAQTTGLCTAAPQFSGVNSVSTSYNNTCSLDVTWPSASSYCQSSTTYNIYRSTDPAFEPGPANQVASQLNSLSFTDFGVLHDQLYHYIVRAVDASNGNEENNQLVLFAKPLGANSDGTWTAGAEVGDSGIDQSSRHLGWEMVTDVVFDGDRSYWSQDGNNTCNRLTTQPFDLTPGEASELSFFTQYDIEDRYDGGVVEISVDGGPWQSPDLSPSYPNTFRSAADECGYDENTPAFSGEQNSWQQHTMDLSPFQAQQVAIRFSYSTDGSVRGNGWFLDNLAVTHTQIPGICQSMVDVIFADGFQQPAVR
ncbi:choice-of-anchor B family protein [Marinicella sediminis]|uniref:Choice-of-anchor B family protein n=1 Tax=Marinicella sediminis TaxID=1792834 RepID=A0ABV7J9Q0_9GAMM|nr:choice-of-anchor B family protein [Marinicella sediminis]